MFGCHVWIERHSQKSSSRQTLSLGKSWYQVAKRDYDKEKPPYKDSLQRDEPNWTKNHPHEHNLESLFGPALNPATIVRSIPTDQLTSYMSKMALRIHALLELFEYYIDGRDARLRTIITAARNLNLRMEQSYRQLTVLANLMREAFGLSPGLSVEMLPPPRRVHIPTATDPIFAELPFDNNVDPFMDTPFQHELPLDVQKECEYLSVRRMRNGLSYEFKHYTNRLLLSLSFSDNTLSGGRLRQFLIGLCPSL